MEQIGRTQSGVFVSVRFFYVLTRHPQPTNRVTWTVTLRRGQRRGTVTSAGLWLSAGPPEAEHQETNLSSERALRPGHWQPG